MRPGDFQVAGIPRKSGQCLAVIYSNIVVLNSRLFTKYFEARPGQQIHTKKHLKKLFQMPLREIKHRTAGPLELISGSSPEQKICNASFRKSVSDFSSSIQK